MKQFLKKPYFFSVVLLFLLVPVFKTHGQSAEPAFWVTWSALNYSNSEFLGKSLPSNGTTVIISLELVSGGKILTLNSKEVRWFIDGRLIKKGLGIKELSFPVTAGFGSHAVRIELPNFNEGNSLVKTITIPVARPEVVISSPLTATNNKTTSREIILKALPYFFNVTQFDSLIWSWNINNQTPNEASGKPNSITITIPKEMPAGSQILVKAKAENKIKVAEKGESMTLFTIQ